MSRAQTPAESLLAAALTQREAPGSEKQSPAGGWWHAVLEYSVMHCVALCLFHCVRKTLEAWLWTLKVESTYEVVSGCRCVLGDHLLVLPTDWKEAHQPAGHHLCLQMQLQHLKVQWGKKTAHPGFLTPECGKYQKICSFVPV